MDDDLSSLFASLTVEQK
jgi:hypothetical protein